MLLRSILFATVLATTPALAAAAPDGERRLSAEQVEQILDQAAAQREAAELNAEEEQAKAAWAVHGDVGFAVGTGGYREAFGTAVIPLGEQGVAAISFDTGRDRGFRYR